MGVCSFFIAMLPLLASAGIIVIMWAVNVVRFLFGARSEEEQAALRGVWEWAFRTFKTAAV